MKEQMVSGGEGGQRMACLQRTKQLFSLSMSKGHVPFTNNGHVRLADKPWLKILLADLL